jgi:hypothetical protein
MKMPARIAATVAVPVVALVGMAYLFGAYEVTTGVQPAPSRGVEFAPAYFGCCIGAWLCLWFRPLEPLRRWRAFGIGLAVGAAIWFVGRMLGVFLLDATIPALLGNVATILALRKEQSAMADGSSANAR